MDYFILLPGDDLQSLNNAANFLGSESFGNFWHDQGLDVLYKISETHSELLSDIIIITDTGTKLTVDQFLIRLESLTIKKR